MTYKQALKKSDKRGAGAVEPNSDEHLAVTVYCATLLHPGLSQEMVYEGAKRNNTSADAIRKMNAMELADLMFDGMGV